MTERSSIEWTDTAWNPVTGCTKVSPGGAHCHTEAVTLRFRRGPAFLPGVTRVALHPERLGHPLSWRRPRRIFLNRMSDLFHEEVPADFIRPVFDVMAEASPHIFQVLTKRAARMLELAPGLCRPFNVWAGVSVGNAFWAANRLPLLSRVPAEVRFVSLDPLLGPVDPRPRISGLDRVVVEGESGPRFRAVRFEWVVDVRDVSVAAGVSLFFQQWGGSTSRARGRDLEGREWSEFPRPAPAVPALPA